MIWEALSLAVQLAIVIAAVNADRVDQVNWVAREDVDPSVCAFAAAAHSSKRNLRQHNSLRSSGR